MAKASFLSWFAVTTVFLAALYLDGASLRFSASAGVLAFCLLVSFIVAMYFAVFGTLAWYFLSRRQLVTRATLVQAGFFASIPMLIACILFGELEWIFATLLAGFIGGAVYAFQLRSDVST